jgi:hypothetical protein
MGARYDGDMVGFCSLLYSMLKQIDWPGASMT